MGIKFKVGIAFALVIITAVIISAVMFFYVHTLSFKARAESEMTIISELVGINIDAALRFNDKDEVVDVLHKVLKNSEVKEAHIILNDTIFVGTSLPSKSYQNFRKSNEEFFKDSDDFWIIKDLKDIKGNVAGKIAIRSSMKKLELEQAKIRDIILLIFAVLIIISFILARYLTKSFIRPLLDIESKVKTITETGESSIRLTPQSDDEIGKLVGYINEMLDSLQYQAEVIRDNEMKYRLIAENTADTIWMTDMNLNFTYVSPSEKSLRGFTNLETRNQSLVQILTPDSHRIAVQTLHNFLLSLDSDDDHQNVQTSFILELELIHRNGNIILTENRIKVLTDKDNKPIGVLGITHDITEKRKAEIEHDESRLRDQKQRDALAELATNQFVSKGQIDKAKSILTEISANTINVETVSIWLINENENKLKCIDKYHRTSNSHSYEGELDINTYQKYYNHLLESYQLAVNDVTKHPATLNIYDNYLKPLRISSMLDTMAVSETGTKCILCFEHIGAKREWHQDEMYFAKVISSLVIQTLDTAKRKDLEYQLKKNEEKLIQSQKLESLGILAGGIAHDFNNILAGIYGYIQLLQMTFKDNTQALYFLEQTMKASERAKDLISQILAFARKSDSEKIPVGILNIAKEVHKLIKASIPSTIIMNLEYKKNPGLVMANPTQIHQVLVNLCTNAYQAINNERGTICIALDAVYIYPEDKDYQNLSEGMYCKITVADNGKGIDKSIIDKIFDPYFTTKAQGEGTGLGLSTVLGIVKNHHGVVKVYSEIGKGTTFTVLLPLVVDENAEIQQMTANGLLQGTERILLVDDEEAIIEANKMMLNHLGYSVLSFTSAIEAAEHFRNNPNSFDLLISDMNMPGMNGLELINDVRSIRNDLPVIVCTGFSSKLNNVDIDKYNINKLIMKPLTIKDLSDNIREIFDSNIA